MGTTSPLLCVGWAGNFGAGHDNVSSKTRKVDTDASPFLRSCMEGFVGSDHANRVGKTLGPFLCFASLGSHHAPPCSKRLSNYHTNLFAFTPRNTIACTVGPLISLSEGWPRLDVTWHAAVFTRLHSLPLPAFGQHLSIHQFW